MPFSFILLIFLGIGGSEHLPSSRPAITRQIEAILLAQDARDANAKALTEALASSDSKLRCQALLAYASIQDTLALPRLLPLVQDPDSSVRDIAALAIGQTAMLMSPAGRTQLVADLYLPLVAGKYPPRLIEELGKVVTQAGLDTLVATCKRQNEPPRIEVINAVARAAIRGVVTESATRCVVAAVNGDRTPWQVAYALQRIGEHPETHVALTGLGELSGHPDPLVRLNLASLFGKVIDTLRTEAVLRHLAFQDSDWRVRVNALRALAVYRANTPARDVVLQAATGSNVHVAVSAVLTLGQIHLPDESRNAIRHTSVGHLRFPPGWDSTYFVNIVKRFLDSLVTEPNGRWQVRAEGLVTYAKRLGNEARIPIRSVKPDNLWMYAREIQALGIAGSVADIDTLAATIVHEPPLVACAALEALQNIRHRHPSDTVAGNNVFKAALQSLPSPDMAIRTTAASLLGDSLLARPAAVEPLLAAGKKVKLPDDIEVLQQIVTTLGSIGDRRALPFLRAQLASGEPGIGEQAAQAIGKITGKEPPLPPAKPRLTLPDFAMLRSLPDTIHIRMTTSQGTIACELYPRMAPFTVVSFVKLARNGFYNGLVFHRVVPNFVVQGGDPRGDGWGGPGYTIRSEFSPLRFETGTLGMASAGKDTEGSQFFITHSPQPHLDGRYTVFGRVVEGMEVVDKLQIGDTIKTIQISGI